MLDSTRHDLLPLPPDAKNVGRRTIEVCGGRDPPRRQRGPPQPTCPPPSPCARSSRPSSLRDGLTTRGPGLHGLTIQAKALAAAAASHEQPGDPVLLVVPTDAELDAVVGDVRFFLGAIEGLSDGALGGLVLPLPSLQVDPYRALAPHMRVTSARARALLALATGHARVVVASAPALLPRLPEPGALVARSLGVKVDADVDPQSLAALLTDGGYDRHDPVEQHGEFCLRGGILDVYPPNELWPIRIEFIGDMVESIRRFDPDTQRSVESLDQFMVVPVRESTDPADLPVDLQRAATIFDYLAARKSGRLCSCPSPTKCRRRSSACGRRCRPATTKPSTRGTTTAAALTPPEALFIGDADVRRALGRATRLSALDVDESATPLAHVPTQPIAHFRGRVADWVTELRERQAAGDAVIFVAHTAGRAERTLEMLKDYDVRAASAPAHQRAQRRRRAGDARRKLEPAERGQGQGDRVGEREGGDHTEDLAHDVAQVLARQPASPTAGGAAMEDRG